MPERFRQFEKFLASAGVDPNSQVEELAWGLIAEGVTDKTSGTGSTAVPTGEEIVGVVLPNGWVPVRLDGSLPILLGTDGRLRAQVRPGNWQIVGSIFQGA